MARRTAGKVLAASALLGLVALIPVGANAGSGSAAGADGDARAAAGVVGARPSTDAPPESGPLLLLLVAGGIGTMGVLSRESRPGDGGGRGHPTRG